MFPPPTTIATSCKALELEHLGAFVGQHLAHGLLVVVDPGLVVQHLGREEALVQHALDNLLTCLLGLREDLVGVGVDLALGRGELLGDVLTPYPLRR